MFKYRNDYRTNEDYVLKLAAKMKNEIDNEKNGEGGFPSYGCFWILNKLHIDFYVYQDKKFQSKKYIHSSTIQNITFDAYYRIRDYLNLLNNYDYSHIHHLIYSNNELEMLPENKIIPANKNVPENKIIPVREKAELLIFLNVKIIKLPDTYEFYEIDYELKTATLTNEDHAVAVLRCGETWYIFDSNDTSVVKLDWNNPENITKHQKYKDYTHFDYVIYQKSTGLTKPVK